MRKWEARKSQEGFCIEPEIAVMRDTKFAKENAILAATAPEMLDFIKLFASYADELEWHDMSPQMKKLAHDANFLIKKANGK